MHPGIKKFLEIAEKIRLAGEELRSGRLRRSRWKEEMNGRRREHQHQQAKHARFRTRRAPGEPNRTLRARTHQVAAGQDSAIRRGVEKSLAPIPSRMDADGQPQVSRAPQDK